MCTEHSNWCCGAGMDRRDFIKTMGVVAASVSMASGELMGATGPEKAIPRKKNVPFVRGAFVYPPSEILRKEGYYSWPGSSFDAEGKQKEYVNRLKKMEDKLAMRIDMEKGSLDTDEDVNKFIHVIKNSKPDGLLLIPFKKGHWGKVIRIVEETNLPTVILATMGVLLMPHVRQIYKRPGVYMINSLDNLDAVEEGMKMIKVARWMSDARIVNINGKQIVETIVPIIGTQVRTVPHQMFYDDFKGIKNTDEVKALAKSYLQGAKEIVEPSKDDIFEAAKTYFVSKGIIKSQKADALMMNCLPGLKRPHQHVPPCMGYMNLRDEGIAMGCESDLDATLTMMLLQEFFGKPGFQHNPSVDTEKNLYFGAHCTSASKMSGVDGTAEPVILRNHAEAGWGVVPRVLFKKGQEVTIAKYLSVKKPNETPQMLIYSGEIVDCPPIPPTGGCRTNVITTLNELENVAELKGHHLILIYGNHAKQLRDFCLLHKIVPKQ
ncbi:hypothetical protein H8E88_29085 [candidate division KSB1 bacterium]|nr:hypothetical protein [candidate division KSB1 bacterium]MBL7095536.1 hypothetical protein [candidate division KSB1 bacterium]